MGPGWLGLAQTLRRFEIFGGKVVDRQMKDLTGRTLGKTWHVRELLAEGGMGRVYAASHLRTGQQAAVKVIKTISPDPAMQERLCKAFEREAQLLASLSHPAVVEVYETGRSSDGIFYLIQEFVEGSTFAEEVEANGPLREDFAIELTVQVLDGLAFLHSQQPPVILRDLTPRNLMISESDDSVRIIDFGLAREVVDGQSTRQTIKGFGSEGFCPLEQYGSGTDQRSDLYSLGANLYFLLTGRVPVSALNRAAGVEHLLPITDFRDDVSATTLAAVDALMKLRRDERPATADEARGLFPDRSVKTPGMSRSSHMAEVAKTNLLSEPDGPGFKFTAALSRKLDGKLEKEFLVWIDEAQDYLADGDDSAAIACLERVLQEKRAIKDERTWAEVLQEIGTFMHFEGRVYQALHFLNRCLEIDSTNWRAHLSLGRLYVQIGQHNDSSYHLSQFRNIAPAAAVEASIGENNPGAP